MASGAIQLLLVEDNPGDARLIKLFLDESRQEFAITHTTGLSDTMRFLAHGHPDTVLLDLGLPDSQGLATLRETRKAAPEVPVVILTGLNDEELAVDALKEGAQDYLVKGSIESKALVKSVRYAIERQRLLAENERLRVQQMALKDEFLSHVSHELRSPLNAIYQFVSILSDGLAGECNPQQREFLQIIWRNAGQLKTMIGELLDVTRAAAAKLIVNLRTVEVAPIVQEVCDTVRAAANLKNIALRAEMAEDLPRVLADPDRLRQILVNLLDNAVKFTPEAGKVTVRVSAFETSPPVLKFSVMDTGCGIAAELHERIFERLYQVSSNDGARTGLGLGLYICRELVKLQGGNIFVEQSSSSGTTFSFSLPVMCWEEILHPVLSQNLSAGAPVAIVRVELHPAEIWLTEQAREAASSEAHEELRRCLRPNSDVVLPRLRWNGDSEFLFAAAPTDAKGAEIIKKRVNAHFLNDRHLREIVDHWSLEFRIVQVQGDGADAGTASAAQLIDVIRGEIRKWSESAGGKRE